MSFIRLVARRVPFLLMVLVLSVTISIPSAAARSTIAVPAQVRAELKQDGTARVTVTFSMTPTVGELDTNHPTRPERPSKDHEPNGKGPNGNGPPGHNKPGNGNNNTPPSPGGNNPNGNGPKGKGPEGSGPPGPNTSPNGNGKGNGPFSPFVAQGEVEPIPEEAEITAFVDQQVDDTWVQMIAERQDEILAALPPGSYTVVSRYSHVPAITLDVNQAAVNKLSALPLVDGIAPELTFQLFHDNSVPLINADDAQALGYTGNGVQVAVIDTGVEDTHQDIVGLDGVDDVADDLIYKYCFDSATSACPGSPGGASGNDANDYDGHGSHVSGTITSDGNISPTGVAPDADLIAMRVGHAGDIPNTDLLNALNHLIANHTSGANLGTDVINMSLGDSSFITNSTATCDARAATAAIHTAITTLVNSGVTVVVASGNDASTAGVSWPACLSNVVSVGSSYDSLYNGTFTYSNCSDADPVTDQISCFTNRNSILDIMAPGALITSVGLGGGTDDMTGTSMASPHVAGVAALMKEAEPTLTPAEVETLMKTETSVFVYDAATNFSYPRVDALGAVSGALDNAPKTIYVNDNAAGLNNGTSWANAYINLQDALSVATYGDEIWVASGTYWPDQGTGYTNNDQQHSFWLKDGVEIYGGFAATETDIDQRNPFLNFTILSGDIDKNGVRDVANAYNVVTGYYVNSSAVLDGVNIINGNASQTGGFFGSGGGMTLTYSSPRIRYVQFSANAAVDLGGGVFAFASSPYITDSQITSNTSSSDGGGYNNYLGDPVIQNTNFLNNTTTGGAYGGGFVSSQTHAQPRLLNVIFQGNTAPGGVGGGLATWGGSSIVVRNGGFYSNTAIIGGWGGGVYLEFGGASSIANSVFSGNQAQFGGAIFLYETTAIITNITAWNNGAAGLAGGLYNFDPTGPVVSSTINNSIFWQNTPGAITNNGATSSVGYSNIQSGCPAGSSCTNVLSSDPLFVDADGADNSIGTVDDNLQISTASPAVDSGNNSADLYGGSSNPISNTPLDFAGGTRRLNIPTVVDTGSGTSPIVDRGAYETYTIPFTINYNSGGAHLFTCTPDGLNYQCYLPVQITGLVNGRSYTIRQVLKQAQSDGVGGYRLANVGTLASFQANTTYTGTSGATIAFFSVLYTIDTLGVRDLTLNLTSNPVFVELQFLDNTTNQCVRSYFIYNRNTSLAGIASGTSLPTALAGQNQYGCGKGYFPVSNYP